MAVNLISGSSFDKQILQRLYLQITYIQKQIERNLEPAWNYYSHTHLVESIFMLLLLVNKLCLANEFKFILV